MNRCFWFTKQKGLNARREKQEDTEKNQKRTPRERERERGGVTGETKE